MELQCKGPVTRYNFSCNWQRNSTLGRCKIGRYMFPSQFANIFLTYQTIVTNLHLLRVELQLQGARKIAPCNRALKVRRAHYFYRC